jgi:hypothetical protein
MPVTKFRSFEDAERALWMNCDDPALPRRIRALWSRNDGGAPLNAVRGVHVYRSIEEANAERNALEDARIRWIREHRVRK